MLSFCTSITNHDLFRYVLYYFIPKKILFCFFFLYTVYFLFYLSYCQHLSFIPKFSINTTSTITQTRFFLHEVDCYLFLTGNINHTRTVIGNLNNSTFEGKSITLKFDLFFNILMPIMKCLSLRKDYYNSKNTFIKSTRIDAF